MLHDCTAFIATGGTVERDELTILAESLGFGTVMRAGEPQARRPASPVTFFLLHHNDPPDRKRSVLQALRRSRDDNVRFAPAIVAGQRLTHDAATRYVAEGFDDVIALPVDMDAARARLAEQLGTTRDYFETSTYFGPDRRRHDTSFRVGTKGYVLWKFRRDTLTGTSVHLARMAGPPPAARPAEWMRVPAY